MPIDIERLFTTYEMKDAVGNRIGYMIKCNTCEAKEHFMLKDKHRGNKVKKWLAKHEHLIQLAN